MTHSTAVVTSTGANATATYLRAIGLEVTRQATKVACAASITSTDVVRTVRLDVISLVAEKATDGVLRAVRLVVARLVADEASAASAHPAKVLRAVASNVAHSTTLVAFAITSDGGNWTVASIVTWLLTLAAQIVCFDRVNLVGCSHCRSAAPADVGRRCSTPFIAAASRAVIASVNSQSGRACVDRLVIVEGFNVAIVERDGRRSITARNASNASSL